MRRTLAIVIASALGATALSADAVTLNLRGTGQVLIYPYYTVNNQQTLVSVINTTARGKALKVRFREGYDGRDVANFNVYLGPYDSWVGAVFDMSADGTGTAAIATNDNSCTVPAFDATFFANGKVLTFGNKNYSQGDYGTPNGTDSGPTGLARTREGFFEIIEMGEVVDQASGSQRTLEAITPVNGVPAGCAQVQSAWAAGGYWTASANADLLPPAGGVYGAAGIVNVAQGTLYAYDATAIDGFSDVIQHTGPGETKPNLSTAVTDSASGIATAYVPIGNATTKADYPAPSRGIDAVSAVLIADSLLNEFDSEPGVGAQSDFLATFPTKQFYVDPGIVGKTTDSYLPPFEALFGGGLDSGGVPRAPAQSCIAAAAHFHDREGNSPPNDLVCGLPPPGGYNYLCYETGTIPLGAHQQSSGALQSGLAGELLEGPVCAQRVAVPFDAGNVLVHFEDPGEALRPALDGKVFRGVPALGFVAVNYVNANVTPGVLSNYSGTYPHRPTVTCIDSIGRGCVGDSSGTVTFTPLSPAPAPLAIFPNPINAGTGTGSSATVTYSAVYASDCSVSSSAGTPSPSGSGTCPAVSLSSTPCTGSGSPLNCSGNGTVTEPTPLFGPSSCSYTLTATCNPGGVTSSANLSVVPNGGGGGDIPAACQNLVPIGTGTAGQYWSQVLTTKVRFGDGTTTSGVDATSYVAVWSYPGTTVPWPGNSGLTTRPTALVNQYFAEKFTAPTDGSVTGHPNWVFSGSGINSNMSMTMGICPGDFGQTGTQLTAGCRVPMSNSSSGLTAVVSASQLGSYCSLVPGRNYYLNILPMANLPSDNVSVSGCSGTCTPWLGIVF